MNALLFNQYKVFPHKFEICSFLCARVYSIWVDYNFSHLIQHIKLNWCFIPPCCIQDTVLSSRFQNSMLVYNLETPFFFFLNGPDCLKWPRIDFAEKWKVKTPWSRSSRPQTAAHEYSWFRKYFLFLFIPVFFFFFPHPDVVSAKHQSKIMNRTNTSTR